MSDTQAILILICFIVGMVLGIIATELFMRK